MNYLKLGLIGIIILTVGISLGYYLAPTKVRIEEKIIEKEKSVKEENKKITEEYDPSTGKITKRIEETGKKETNTNTTKNERIEEKTKDQKHYALKGGVALDPKNGFAMHPRAGVEMRLPFFNSWAGIEGDINVGRPLVGGYLRLEF